jgi:hypothetical protein
MKSRKKVTHKKEKSQKRSLSRIEDQTRCCIGRSMISKIHILKRTHKR